MNLINVLQIVVALGLVAVILLQPQGTGLGRAWGGSGTSYRSKRGMEKVMFFLTVVLAVVFAGLSIFSVLR